MNLGKTVLVGSDDMILEVAVLNVLPDQTDAFESAFSQAESIIASMPGYLSHELQKCLEIDNQYLLLVHWESLKAHTQGFRQSPDYAKWKNLLHHFYDPFPTVLHYQKINLTKPSD